jgi:hypothetical protein
MLLGFDTFARFPFSTVGDDNSVSIAVSGNNLILTIGPVGISTTSIVQTSGADPLFLGIGTITISGTGQTDVTGSPLIMATGNVSVSGTAGITITGNQLTINSGTVTISGTASVSVNGNELALNSNGGGGTNVIVWNEIIPGANMVWTPIVPY